MKSKIFLILFFYSSLISAFADKGPVNIQVRHYQIPILTEVDHNPIIRIKVISDDAPRLTSIKMDLSGTSNLADIEKVSLYYSGEDSVFKNDDLLSEIKDIKSQSKFSIRKELINQDSYLWISCQLKPDVDLTNKIHIEIKDMLFEKGYTTSINQDVEKSSFRYGVAVRSHGQDGIDTYRIPGLTTSEEGTLMAVYDVRRASARDLQGDIDIGLNRSFDGGKTWEPLQIVIDMKEWGGLPEKFNGVSDASILVNGDDIYIAGLWMYGVIDKNGKWVEGLNEDSDDWNHQWRNKGSQPGFDVKQTSQFLIVKSTDNGKTWSEPVNLTKMCKKEEWWLWAPAPGRGIVMDNGTLVFPTQGRDAKGLPFSNITYSKDNGKSWQTSASASTNTTECSVVEYEKGKLMLNIRDNRNRRDKSSTNGRAVFTTLDLGLTWVEHETSHGTLNEPVCMGSLHKHLLKDTKEEKELLFFCNPNSKYERKNITVRLSLDKGMTWPKDKWILLDEGKGRGYSCITSINEHTIGVLYEGSRADMVFQQIDLKDFLVE